ncbi:MAG: acyl carrier protein [Anaerolineales bacterium]|nr:acyl carrier protein [Anaerolineales bacterium]MDW8162247.1 acyl carrier protein [Anaerolineales bacterium]
MSENVSSNPLTNRIREALSLALQVPIEGISDDLAFGDLPQWDSMGHMEVMMRLEESFGIEINAETIAALTSVAAIRQYLESNHLAAPS